MNRYDLDALVAHYELDAAGAEQVLELAGARPSRAERVRFLARMLQLAGVLSLAAGVVFFIAANWDAFAVFGRFALIEILLLVAVGLALWQPPPRALGRFSLLMAFILTGTLLALLGQTYQTGADVYELFLSWALLGIVFVLAARWSVVCAAWALVLNVALWLYCGWRPETGWFWVLFAGWDLDLALLVLGPMLVNLGLFALAEYAERTQYAYVAPRWLGRFVLACAVGFATWAGVLAIVEIDDSMQRGQQVLALLGVLIAFAAVVAYALRKRSDVFPLALIAGSAIVLTTTALAQAMDADELALFFVLALWLIASSTVSGRLLMSLVRTWRTEADA